MTDTYYVTDSWGEPPWIVWKNTATGRRRVATGMSRATARKVARLLNASHVEEQQLVRPSHPAQD